MTTLTSDCPNVCPSVFEAGLPVFGYDHLTDPDEALRVIADTRRLTPIAIGPYGPEVLSYDLVRTVLRDNRFITAKGLALDVKGITSGPLWDRATRSLLSLDGAVHHRLRRLVSTGVLTPRRRATTHPGRGNHHRVGRTRSPPSDTAMSSPTSPGAIRRPSSARCWARRPRIGNCSPAGSRTSRRFSSGTSSTTHRRSWRRLNSKTPISRS